MGSAWRWAAAGSWSDLSQTPEVSFEVARGQLVLRGEPPSGALWILHAFARAQAEQVPLSQELAWRIRRCLWEGGGTLSRAPELSVCAFDRRGLFAQLAGTLTAHGANILSADVYTRRDGIVIDTFWLAEIGTSQPIGPERWPRIERSLREAVCGRMDVAEAVWMWRLRAQRSRSQASSRASPPPVVRCEAEASAHCTVIEVKAEDVPGLAYAIAHALEALGVNIVFAKIATEKGLAFDVFYVTDATGGKLTPALMLDAERAVAEAVRALSRGSSVKATSCREV